MTYWYECQKCKNYEAEFYAHSREAMALLTRQEDIAEQRQIAEKESAHALERNLEAEYDQLQDGIYRLQRFMQVLDSDMRTCERKQHAK